MYRLMKFYDNYIQPCSHNRAIFTWEDFSMRFNFDIILILHGRLVQFMCVHGSIFVQRLLDGV